MNFYILIIFKLKLNYIPEINRKTSTRC